MSTSDSAGDEALPQWAVLEIEQFAERLRQTIALSNSGRLQQVLRSYGLPETPPEVLKLATILAKETDRGCVLVAVSYIDEELAQLLRAFFVNDERLTDSLLGFDGGLGTLSSRISMCSALGLISKKAKNDLNAIRKIRNDFAHTSSDISFMTNSVSDKCKNLSNDILKDERLSPRQKFTRAVLCLLALIVCQKNAVTHRQIPNAIF